MSNNASFLAFSALVTAAITAAWAFARRAAPCELPHPAGWALAGRGLGAGGAAVLLGGTVYTAYTVTAAPGLARATGGFGLYALTYTLLLAPMALVFLPRMRELADRGDLVTTADFARARHGSHALALAVALTGLLAAMPYLALQALGLEAAVRAMGISPRGLAGVLVLVAVFVVLTAALLPGGLRACAELARYKAVLLVALLVTALVLSGRRAGPPRQVFAAAGRALADEQLALSMPHGTYTAYITLAVGSALAQLMYPQMLLTVLAARSPDVVRRAVLALPLWTLALGLFSYLGFVSLAAGIRTPPGHAEQAVPLLLQGLGAPWLGGLLLGALAVAALLPAAVIALGAATLVARNIYSEYFNPTATPKHEVRVARFAAVVIAVGALAFALDLHPQDAVNLHLLGGVWIIQTVPAVGLSAFTRWFHHRALLVGWAAGMALGTALTVSRGFSSVVDVGAGTLHLPVYVALTALVVNLVLVVALTPLLDRVGVRRRREVVAGRAPVPRRGSPFAVRVD
ncbi:sodium:solute symporter [Streptomyces sp. NPDC058308]|uniref:sodium:solute symporter family transporter n=1 Tax=Streptomyces sp. NPDC058308 TaxID=3346440 RepID=UPI0036E4823C